MELYARCNTTLVLGGVQVKISHTIGAIRFKSQDSKRYEVMSPAACEPAQVWNLGLRAQFVTCAMSPRQRLGSAGRSAGTWSDRVGDERALARFVDTHSGVMEEAGDLIRAIAAGHVKSDTSQGIERRYVSGGMWAAAGIEAPSRCSSRSALHSKTLLLRSWCSSVGAKPRPRNIEVDGFGPTL